MEEVSLIVIGSVNTDIIVSGVPSFPKPNNVVYGGKFIIGPGGKSRNMAAMAGALLPPQTVAMISKTARDFYGLWEPPVAALKAAHVNVNYVKILDQTETSKHPSVVLIAVDRDGNNQCFAVPGILEDFAPEDIDAAAQLFIAAAAHQGILALTLECPWETALHSVRIAKNFGLRVVLDPGGITPDMGITDLLREEPYLIKPNEWETQTITGVMISDLASARRAAQKLQSLGAQNVLITQGEQGAYLFTGEHELHIPVTVTNRGKVKDSTGCGDQTAAALCAALLEGKPLPQAAKQAILAGSLQFYKAGIQPITKNELNASI